MPVENFRRAGPSENLRGFEVMLQTLHLLLFKRNDYRSVPGGSDFGLRRFDLNLRVLVLSTVLCILG